MINMFCFPCFLNQTTKDGVLHDWVRSTRVVLVLSESDSMMAVTDVAATSEGEKRVYFIYSEHPDQNCSQFSGS